MLKGKLMIIAQILVNASIEKDIFSHPIRHTLDIHKNFIMNGYNGIIKGV